MAILEDDALYEDFLGAGVADNNCYADYYDNYPATHKIAYYGWASFFEDDENDSDFDGF